MTAPEVVYEGFNSGAQGNKMNLTMMNMITMQWLDKMDRKLNAIVRLEFANDLKAKSLYELMPRIAMVVPQLLQRSEAAATIAKLSLQDSNDEGVSALINKVYNNNNYRDKGVYRNNTGKYNRNVQKFKKNMKEGPRAENHIEAKNNLTCMHCIA